MNNAAADEVAVLSAIYCEQNEFELVEESVERGIVFRVNLPMDGFTVTFLFHLPPHYPHSPPAISVSSGGLSRQQCHSIKESLLHKSMDLLTEPMIHELLSWFKDNSDSFVVPIVESIAEHEHDTWMSLLHLDHMRSKTKYVKVIERFTSELSLTGRLFLGRPILILLQGARENIKEYLHLQKTTKIDLDSSGKRCKEKMMTILCESALCSTLQQLPTFDVIEFSSLEDLRTEFENIGLVKMYDEFVPSLLSI